VLVLVWIPALGPNSDVGWNTVALEAFKDNLLSTVSYGALGKCFALKSPNALICDFFFPFHFSPL
jgi:hypothetical protein